MGVSLNSLGSHYPLLNSAACLSTATEIIKFQRAKLTDVPVVKNQQVHAVVDCCPALVILTSTERVREILLGHVQGLVALDFLSVSFMLRADRFHQHSIRYRIDQTIS